MEASLNRIIMEMQKCEKESENCINSLNQTVMKWESIRNSFDNFSQNLGSLNNYKGLRSKLELEQLVVCDSIIAELGRQILLFDHSINQCKGILAKAQDTFASKPLDFPWKFPPEGNMESVGDLYQSASMALHRAQTLTESRKLALFNLTSSRNSYDPDVLVSFIQQWNKDV